MNRAVVGALAICLAFPHRGIPADTQGDPAQPIGESTYKLKATLVSVDLAKMQVTYRDVSTGALASATLSGRAVSQVVKLKAGTSVNLQLRSAQPADTLLVESIKKRSHKKILILGLVLATVVGAFIFVANLGPI